MMRSRISTSSAEWARVGRSRRRFLVTAASVPAVIGGWALAGRAWAQPASAAAEEAQAPPLPALGAVLRVPSIALLDGSVFDPDRRPARPLLIYWWASICPFCALQSPHMETFWRKHRGQIDFLGLSIDRHADLARQYLIRRGYTFPSAWASPQWRQGFPKPKGLPITLLLDAAGRVRAAEQGQMFAEDIEALADLLA